MLNKNIVYLVDDIFWNMGFKTETQANKVILYLLNALLQSIILIMSIILIISNIRIIAGSSRSSTCRPRVAGLDDVDFPIRW